MLNLSTTNRKRGQIGGPFQFWGNAFFAYNFASLFYNSAVRMKADQDSIVLSLLKEIVCLPMVLRREAKGEPRLLTHAIIKKTSSYTNFSMVQEALPAFFPLQSRTSLASIGANTA